MYVNVLCLRASQLLAFLVCVCVCEHARARVCLQHLEDGTYLYGNFIWKSVIHVVSKYFLSDLILFGKPFILSY
jgi:hypothetical protein